MKLSDAILLGSVMYPPNNGELYFGSGCGLKSKNDCGCALGRAWLAVGRKYQDWNHSWAPEWPWVSICVDAVISRMFKTGVSIEKIAEYVRSIEPSCGECNEYKCTCVKENHGDSDGRDTQDFGGDGERLGKVGANHY